MTTAAALLRATHLAPSLLVTAISGTLAATVGRGVGGVLAVASAVLAGQFSVGWGNDWIDRRRDAATGRPDKPIVAGAVAPDVVITGALVALAACAALSLLSGWRAAAVHLLAVGLAWSYNLGVKATPASVLPYAGAFGLLPVFVTVGLPGAPLPAWWAVAGASLLGAGAHFTNTLPDLEGDGRTGVRGLPHRLGRGRSLLAAVALLVAGAVLVLTGAGFDPATYAGLALVAALVAGVVAATRMRRERLAWSLTLALAGVAMLALAVGGASVV